MEDTVGGGKGNSDKASSGSGKDQTKEKKPEKPYAALKPPKGAKPLDERFESNSGDLLAMQRQIPVDAAEEQYANETGGETTGGETTGGETTGGSMEGDKKALRTVPLGETLLADKEDPSDGPLKNNRLVAYYGHPYVAEMGILGEYDPKEMMAKLKEQAAVYSELDPERPAIPTIEFIASVAQRDPGEDGLYVTQTPKEEIDKYLELAKKNDALLILDVQLGRATVMQEVEILAEYLKEPNVHLAIDTEYSIDEGEIPGQDLGEVDGAEIQEAVEYLDKLVEKEGIPDKILMVHQFEAEIVTNKPSIQPTDNVEVALHADGFGGPDAKAVKYDFLVRQEPIQYGGFKVFYKQDTPVLEPEEVLQLDPAPAIVTYQ
jgi:nucleotide-binding universal stress UspA family protein